MSATVLRYVCRLLVNCLLVIVGGACQPPDRENVVTEEDYSVYSAFLDAFEFYRNVPSEGAIIILNETTFNPHDINPQTPWTWVRANSGDRCRYYKDEIRCRKAQDPAWAPLFDALKQPINHNSVLLQQRFKIRHPSRVLSQSQVEKLSDENDEQRSAYYIFGLSTIVYSEDQTKALFFSSFICGGKCGRGELVMLEKTNQTWMLVDTFRFWIA